MRNLRHRIEHLEATHAAVNARIERALAQLLDMGATPEESGAAEGEARINELINELIDQVSTNRRR